MISKRQALHQSLASCGAMLIAFIGVCHEFVGHILFPWAPALGGPIAWHGLGIFAITAGIATLGGTLRLYSFPVVGFAILAIVMATAVFLFTAVVHHQFHVFALAAAAAGGMTAHCHRRAMAGPDMMPFAGQAK